MSDQSHREWISDEDLARIEGQASGFISFGEVPPDVTDLCFAVLELRREIQGWKDIAASNNHAYEMALKACKNLA